MIAQVFYAIHLRAMPEMFWEGGSFSQDQPGLGGRKGCAALWRCMPVDSATIQVNAEVTLWGYARNRGEPYSAGGLTAGNSCGAGDAKSAGKSTAEGGSPRIHKVELTLMPAAVGDSG